MSEHPRAVIDTARYSARIQGDNQAGRCFICDLVAGEPDPGGPVIYRDQACVVFFPTVPRLLGYTLLAPLEHRTGVVEDFTEEQYIALQRRVHRLGRALSATVPTERLYIFSLGSNQGVAHVHWHLAPLPPGVPFEQQQFAAVDRPDYLKIPDHERDELARRIAAAMRA